MKYIGYIPFYGKLISTSIRRYLSSTRIYLALQNHSESYLAPLKYPSQNHTSGKGNWPSLSDFSLKKFKFPDHQIKIINLDSLNAKLALEFDLHEMRMQRINVKGGLFRNDNIISVATSSEESVPVVERGLQWS